MPATEHNVTITEKDTEERLSYDDLLAGDYQATLIDVEDAKAQTGNYGWRFAFDVKGLTVKSTVWLKGGGGWKVREVFNALGHPLNPGDNVTADMANALIGRSCVVTVVKEPAHNGATNDDGTPKIYTNISRHTPFVAEAVADFGDL
jgi:hypothetical protein